MLKHNLLRLVMGKAILAKQSESFLRPAMIATAAIFFQFAAALWFRRPPIIRRTVRGLEILHHITMVVQAVTGSGLVAEVSVASWTEGSGLAAFTSSPVCFLRLLPDVVRPGRLVVVKRSFVEQGLFCLGHTLPVVAGFFLGHRWRNVFLLLVLLVSMLKNPSGETVLYRECEQRQSNGCEQTTPECLRFHLVSSINTFSTKPSLVIPLMSCLFRSIPPVRSTVCIERLAEERFTYLAVPFWSAHPDEAERHM